MKKHTLNLIIFFFCSLQLQAQQFSAVTTISVAIKNGKETNAKLTNSEGSVVKEFSIASQRLSDTLIISPGYYELSFSDQYTDLYLEPGFELQASLDYDKFDESLKYEGKGSVENNFMAASMVRHILHTAKKTNEFTEAKFITETNAYFDNELLQLKKLKGASNQFMRLEEKRQYLKKIEAFHKYTIIQNMIKGPTYTVSDSFPDLLSDLNVNDTTLLAISEYARLVSSKIQKQTSVIYKQNPTFDFNMLFLDMLQGTVTEQSVKNRVLAENGISRLAHATNKKAFYEKMMGIVTDEKVKKEITAEYERWKKLEAGNPSPVFSFMDMNNKVVTLKDLQGKFVYIDVWATWCSPCVMEIPHLKKLTESLKDREIQFVSICMNDKKENWKSMVQSKELQGIQLFAENPDDDFFKSYGIDGIPRFILLDRNGLILDANAKRPSDPELIREIESLF